VTHAASRYRATVGGITLSILIVLSGCGDRKGTTLLQKDVATPSESQQRLAAVMGNTVGGSAFLSNGRYLVVRGYGLVVGLGKNGSKECPEPLRGQMLQEIHKQMENGGIYSMDKIDLSARNLLESMDTAVVEVTGSIAPGACKGAKFDVQVQAVAGTDTRSLEGGRLYTCSLHVFRQDSQGNDLEGKAVAKASGPIFQNIVASGSGATTQPDARQGLVLGGGENTVERTMELTLGSDSHRLARQIMNRINEHFGNGHQIADAKSPSRIVVQAPTDWKNNEEHFYELVVHLPLVREEEFLTSYAKGLMGLLKDPTAPAEDIALVLEASGQSAVDVAQGFYTDSNRAVRYYAARVGLRLRDSTAVDVLAREAAEVGSPFREAALAELSHASDVAVARIPLRALINDANVKIRILAYEGLARHNDEKIQRYKCGLGSFTLDVVPSTGQPLIYATRAMEGRIGLIGQNVHCQPPFFYLHPSHAISVSAEAGKDQVTLVRRAPFGQVSEPFQVPLDLGQMIHFMGDTAEVDENTGKVRGLGLSYTEVLDVLQAMCKAKAVPARLEIQSASLSDSLGTIKPLIRIESEITQ
jgi:flagellar basal body P-ring protein FlgI